MFLLLFTRICIYLFNLQLFILAFSVKFLKMADYRRTICHHTVKPHVYPKGPSIKIVRTKLQKITLSVRTQNKYKKFEVFCIKMYGLSHLKNPSPSANFPLDNPQLRRLLWTAPKGGSSQYVTLKTSYLGNWKQQQVKICFCCKGKISNFVAALVSPNYCFVTIKVSAFCLKCHFHRFASYLLKMYFTGNENAFCILIFEFLSNI